MGTKRKTQQQVPRKKHFNHFRTTGAQRTPLYSAQFVLSDRHLIILVRCNIFSSRANCLQTLFLFKFASLLGSNEFWWCSGGCLVPLVHATIFGARCVCGFASPCVCAFTHRRTGGAIRFTRARTNGAMLQLQPLLLQRLAWLLFPGE